MKIFRNRKKSFTLAKYSYPVRRRRNLAGFTLIEILIALVIFSFAIVISSGIFSMILGNQSLISASSEANKEAQRIMRQISDDVANATGSGNVHIHGQSGNIFSGVRGILLLDNQGGVRTPPNDCLINPGNTNCLAAGLVLFGKDNLKIYRKAGNTIQYAQYASDDAVDSITLKLDSNGKLSNVYNFQPLDNDKVEIALLEFFGQVCYSSDCKVAPFVKINFVVQTENYSAKAAGRRAKVQLQTQVSSRSY